jgi:glycosyltransferase involved in cell wall biosynthesis|tara:strand:+ start:2155 stop:3033 length:879 start_codon:yes stop_codon:yes gene_type:complete
MDKKKFSIIIPAYAEEENILQLLNQIDDAFIDKKNIEIVLVDDGSPISLNGIIECEKYRFEIKVISNKYNLGQSKSIEVGLKNSTGEIVGLIDADCQNPPSELKKLYDFYILNNFDAVISFRKDRKDESLRKIISKLANVILKIFTKSKFKDLGSSLKIIKRDCLESLTFKGDMHRFISPMLQARGYSIAELEVEHAERTKGVSKYGFGRIVPVIVDGMLFYLTEGFTRPARYAIGRLSLILFSFSLFFNAIVLYQKIVYSVFVHRNPVFILSMVFLLLSIQVFSQIVKVDQ